MNYFDTKKDIQILICVRKIWLMTIKSRKISLQRSSLVFICKQALICMVTVSLLSPR